MNHEELRERLSAYLEEDLDASEQARIEEHLGGCPDCRQEYRELRHMVDLLRGLPAPDPPPDLADRVIARLRAGEGRPGLVARCQARIAGMAEFSWATPVATVAVGLGVLAVVRGMDVSVEIPGWGQPEPVPQVEAVAERPAPLALRMERPLVTKVEPNPAEAIAPLVACLRAGGPARAEVVRGDPCEHWDSWMVGLGMRDAPAFVVEVESVPAPARDRVLGRIGAFAVRSGSAPLLAGRLRAAGDPRAAKLASRIERTSIALAR
jgi:hypothetical protein